MHPAGKKEWCKQSWASDVGMANGTLWHKTRPPLFPKCPTSPGRCWGRSEDLTCPPVYLLQLAWHQISKRP